MTTAAGYAPFVVRSNDVVPFAFRRILIPQLMPTITSTETSVQYMEETTRTVAAAATAETTSLSEGAIAYTLRTVQIEDIGEFIPVSERQLADAAQVAGLINNSLMTAVDRTHESQIVTGSGTSPQLVGFLGAAASSVQTQALGTDPVISAIMKAITKVNHTGFAEASAVVMHSNDYQDMILLQDASGRYIFGDPASSAPRTVWGLPVVVTTAMTENTALVGDFATYAYNVNRQDVRVEMGWIANNFIDRVRTIRAYKRTALVIRRQAAFCKVTGI
jgi:HK97 family phage major capsid protein